MVPFIACFALLASSATRQLRCRAGHTSLHTPRLPGLVERSPIHLHRCCLYRERSIFESFRCLGVRLAVEDLEQEQPPDKSSQAHRPNNSTKIDMSPVLGAQSERVLAVDLPQLRALSFEKSVKPRLVVTDRHKASNESHGIQDTVTRDELPNYPGSREPQPGFGTEGDWGPHSALGLLGPIGGSFGEPLRFPKSPTGAGDLLSAKSTWKWRGAHYQTSILNVRPSMSFHVQAIFLKKLEEQG